MIQKLAGSRSLPTAGTGDAIHASIDVVARKVRRHLGGGCTDGQHEGRGGRKNRGRREETA